MTDQLLTDADIIIRVRSRDGRDVDLDKPGHVDVEFKWKETKY